MDRKALVREYKETPRPAGVYRILHVGSGRSLIGSSPDAPSALNRHRAQLRMGAHRNAELQRDWEADGADAFKFVVLDTLNPRDDDEYDAGEDLRQLEELWLERLELGKTLCY